MKISIRIWGLRKAVVLVAFVAVCSLSFAQQKKTIIPNSKKISTDLFGLFFEDINYAADGGLYAEQVQNRSFEYNPTERKEWHPLSYWEYITTGFSYGRISVETTNPVHANNPHYIVLDVEHIGKEEKFTGISGVGIKNFGFDGMIVKANDQYNFTMHARQLSKEPVSFTITLQTPQGKILAETKLTTSSVDWKKYTTSLIANQSHDTAQLVILATTKGKTAIDVLSLFPEKTFRNRPNGLRPDLAKLLADMKPSFIRFPGGCLVHGDGLGNMYRWKNTIGPIEERKAQRNIWGYHQTTGIGYFEYFQFCEDIGAKPLPVLPAAVSCQNSGGTWRIGGTGQRALPMEEMQEYIQEVLDLIEWANGPVTSTWGAKRAAAGHPAPFNLQYVGIGNEDKITPEFEQRFKMIHDAVKAKHPNIILVGTSGPFHSGEDFDKGWTVANQLKVDVIDEHYYVQPEWLISNQYRYDQYKRKESKVYLGEYASWGNKLYNAIAEALYMTGLERNGDVVSMASYAPLLAKDKFTQWTTDMIFFNNSSYYLTPNYHVQKLFSANAGDYYVDKVISKNNADSLLAGSCVYDSKTGDIILKLVNGGKSAQQFQLNLAAFPKVVSVATVTQLSGIGTDENSFVNSTAIAPVTSTFNISKKFNYKTPAMSLTVIRIKTK